MELNRSREVIGELVNPFQSAAIPSRQQVDSAVLAREIMVHEKEGKPKIHVEDGLRQII